MIYRDVLFVAINMRSVDRAEIYGMRHDENPTSLARETMLAEIGRVFSFGGQPAAVCGAMERHPGVWSVFAYGTNRFDDVASAITRYARRTLRPYLEQRAHRVECQSRYNNAAAHQWLVWLGAKRECVLRQFGKDGADYYQYVWTRRAENVLHTETAENTRTAAAA